MGRAPNYDVQELEHLAIAWRNATRDNVKGADKKVEVHTAIIENNMKCLAPPGVSDDKYHGRGGERLHQYWRDTIAPELQKFNSALRIVKLSRPTGVGQDEIISMAIAIHQQETKKMDYAFKNYSHDKWRFYKAWLVAKDEPKFAYNAGETATGTTATATNNSNETSDSNSTPTDSSEENKSPELSVSSRSSSNNKGGISANKRHLQIMKAKDDAVNEIRKLRKTIDDKNKAQQNMMAISNCKSMMEFCKETGDTDGYNQAKSKFMELMAASMGRNANGSADVNGGDGVASL